MGDIPQALPDPGLDGEFSLTVNLARWGSRSSAQQRLFAVLWLCVGSELNLLVHPL